MLLDGNFSWDRHDLSLELLHPKKKSLCQEDWWLTPCHCTHRVPQRTRAPFAAHVQEFCLALAEKLTWQNRVSSSNAPYKRCPAYYPSQLKTCWSCQAEFPHSTQWCQGLKAFQVWGVQEERHDEPSLILARACEAPLQTAVSGQALVQEQWKPRGSAGSSAAARSEATLTCRQAGEDSQGVRIVNPLNFEATLAKMRRQ